MSNLDEALAAGEEIRKQTALAVHRGDWPALDELIDRLPTLPTSSVVGYMCDPDALASLLRVAPSYPVSTRDSIAYMSAAMIALQDEIDRRIPIPRKESP